MGELDLKRTILTVLLISAIWMVWMKFFAPKPAPQPTAQQPATPTQTRPSPAPSTGAPTPPPGAPPVDAARRPAEERPVLETERWRAVLTSYGAGIASFELKDAQYRGEGGRPLDLIKTATRPALVSGFEGAL